MDHDHGLPDPPGFLGSKRWPAARGETKRSPGRTTWHTGWLVARLTACVLVLQLVGCPDHRGAGDDPSAQPVPEAQSAQQAQPVPPAQPAQPARSGASNQSPLSEPDEAETDRGDDAPDGACSQTDRDEYIHEGNQEFVGQMRTCSTKNWADKAKNIACLSKEMPSLSRGCVECFADTASCASAHCKAACMFSPKSVECTDCANSHCQASLVTCSGVAAADLP